MADPKPRDIVIAGGGTAGWMAAAMLSRFLERGYRIRLVESDAIGTVGVGEATIPQIKLLNSVLGISEAEFVAATDASFKLGIEFVGWGAPDQRYMHAFGFVGRGSGLTPFSLLWQRLNAADRGGAFGAYSMNEAAARAGRMAPPRGKPGAFPDLVHAYHFDASLYAVFLRRYAEARGVERIEGRIATVDRDSDSGDVLALRLDGDRRVEGDLFIDCTGFRALLIGETMGSPFVDWSHWLPCDSALAVPCERSDAFRPYTQAIAHKAGWQWRIPLQHRTGNGHVYCSRFTSDDEAAATLMDNLDGAPLADPRQLRFTTGHRREYWKGNVVALGLAAGFMEPLESTSIHLVQAGLTRLLTFCFPGQPVAPAVRDSFNRLSTVEWERIRDFLILHYAANGRVGDPFWDACRSIPLPDTLQEKLRYYRATGRVLREDDELFTEEGWSQVLIGQGVKADALHPLAGLAPIDELAAYADDIAAAYARAAASMPTHHDHIAALAANAQGRRVS